MASYHEFNASFGSYTNPYYRPSFGSRLAGGLAKLILLVGVPAGALLALYRNDVLFDGAKQLGREAQFLKLERAWLGGPPSGTPRSLQPLLDPQSSIAAEGSASGSSERASSGTMAALPVAAAIAHPANFASKESPTAPVNTPAPAATTTTATTASEPSTTGSVKVVSLDSLPTERRGAATAPVRSTETPSHSSSPSRSATPARVRSEEEEPVARPSKARSAEPAESRSSRRAQEEDAEPRPKKAKAAAQAEPEAKPAKAAKAAKAAPPPADDNPLKAAIRRAIASDQ